MVVTGSLILIGGVSFKILPMVYLNMGFRRFMGKDPTLSLSAFYLDPFQIQIRENGHWHSHVYKFKDIPNTFGFHIQNWITVAQKIEFHTFQKF